MKYAIAFVFAALLSACGGNSTGPRAPDPHIAVRIVDALDTTTSIGRADWHVFALLSGPYVNQNGVANEGDLSMSQRRGGHAHLCIRIEADSVGQRLLSLLALADTSTEAVTDYTTAQSIANAWFGGNHVLPAHWAVMVVPPQDAWLSVQYAQGHGLVPDDPIKWSWDWTGAALNTFTERTDNDPFCSGVGQI